MQAICTDYTPTLTLSLFKDFDLVHPPCNENISHHHERSIIHLSQRQSQNRVIVHSCVAVASCSHEKWVLPQLSGGCLAVLDDADLCGAKHAAVELEALLLDVEDRVVLLVRLRGHKGGLVLVGVELVAIRV